MKITETNEICMRNKNVNWDEIVRNGYQKIRRYTHWWSYNSKNAKMSVVIGAISRITVHSSSQKQLVQSVVKLFVELRLLMYPWRFFYSVLEKLRRRNNLAPQSSWNRLKRIVEICEVLVS